MKKQASLLSYFTKITSAPSTPQRTVKKESSESTPSIKKQSALKELKKISENLKKKEDSNSDFDAESLSEYDSDEKEFKKILTTEKLNKQNQKQYSYSDYESGYIADEYDEKPKITDRSKSKVSKMPSSPSSRGKNKMDVLPEVAASEIAKNVAASITEESLPDWLSSNLCDAERRPVSDPNYDPTTVYIPPSEENNFTPFQKQFWNIKKNNFNAIVMIRKGKFFEMFSVDALFARDVLKLHLTWRGKEPMCGVPEKAFNEWAMKIINYGKKVCKVEQTETAVDARNKKGSKALTRELVQIYSLGTLDDLEMLDKPQPSYLMSIKSCNESSIALCLVDCSTGNFHIGCVSFDDFPDALIRFEPVEVIYNQSCILPDHFTVLKHYCSTNITRGKGDSSFWDSTLALSMIKTLAKWSEIPEIFDTFPPDAIAALGGCCAYLNEHKIAESLLSLKRFLTLDQAGGKNSLVLDSSALTNLQIIGDDKHNLLYILDKCVTPFGKRRLRYWLMHPLTNKSVIEGRLDAIEELMKSEFTNISKKIANAPDLERMLARVYSNRCTVKILVDCLQALMSVSSFLESYHGKFTSLMLCDITHVAKTNNVKELLEALINKIDVEESLKNNEFIVKSGVYDDIDNIDEEVQEIESNLQEVLADIRKEIGCKEVKFVHMQSEKWQVEIPKQYCKRIPDRYTVASQTKTVSRYYTPEIRELITKMEDVENKRMKIRSGCQKRLIDDFSVHSEIWDSLVDSCADFDCLISLSLASKAWKASGACRPKFIDIDSDEAGGQAILRLRQMRHPCLRNDPIPNDVDIHQKFVLLITGPNASGKSTYARMCCIAIVLAQLGCYIPAESATLTVYDQVFTRIGAGDRLFSGQSTFAVELTETARIMKRSTKRSFVVLDELGRGTSTFDGIAIASAVLEHFINEIKCPLVFCTHYHVIAEQFDQLPMVKNASMKFDVKEKLFLYYSIVDGMCDNSFGCQVAKLCGLSDEITKEAQKIADDFERRHVALHTQSSGIKVEVKELRKEFKDIVDKLQDITYSGEPDIQKYMKLYELLNDKNGLLSLDLS